MSAHASVSVVVPGFIVGGSPPIACTTVPPRTGVCASAAPGSVASSTARTIFSMDLSPHDRVNGGLELARGLGQPRLDGGHGRLVCLEAGFEEGRLALRLCRRG